MELIHLLAPTGVNEKAFAQMEQARPISALNHSLCPKRSAAVGSDNHFENNFPQHSKKLSPHPSPTPHPISRPHPLL